MSWLIFAFLTIIFYSFFDFFLKLSSGKIHDFWAVFIINSISTLVLLFFLLIAYFKGENVFRIKQHGYLFTVLAGISISFASMFFIKVFSTGANLSIAIPLVRVGIVLLASILGILILKESFSLKYIVGFLLSLIGLYLLIVK